MSVRPTQTKSGYPRRTRQPYPTGDGDPAGAPPHDQPAVDRLPDQPPVEKPPGGDPGPVAPPAAPEAESRVAQRRSQRAARHARRTVAVVCGVVVAVCLIITILIVDMARTRTSAPPPVASSSVMSLGPSRPAAAPSLSPFHPTTDAAASQGGNP